MGTANRDQRLGVLAAVAAAFATSAVRADGELHRIAASPGAVSADGSTVVGRGPAQGFRWTLSGGIEYLGDFDGPTTHSLATDVSGDGSVVVGWGTPGPLEEPHAFRWEAGVMSSLAGPLPPGSLPGSRAVDARAISQDGSVIGGHFITHPESGGFLWREGQGFTLVPRGPGMVGMGPVEDLSADGSVIAGRCAVLGSDGTEQTQAFRWTADGEAVALGVFEAEQPFSIPTAISADGSTVVGAAASGPLDHIEAFRWKDGVLQGLGGLSPDSYWTEAYGVSDDGSVVVGVDVDLLRAFIWIEGRGMLDLQQYLIAEHGMTQLQGWTLEVARDITPDGRTIVGSGLDADGFSTGWIVTIPVPSTAALLGLGGLFATRRRRAWIG